MVISVVLITKNEEKNVAPCLESVRWADELIVIDSFSTDQTVEVSRRFTDKVFQREWPGMVGPQRNVGLDIAVSQWVLFLDADERITEALKDEVLGFIHSPLAEIYAAGEIPRKNYFFGKWLKCSYPNYTRRLLKKGAGRYNEQPGLGFDSMSVDKGQIYHFRNPLEHFTSETLAQRFRKIDFDSSLQADEKFRAGKGVNFGKLLLNPLMNFCKIYFLKKGLLEGIPGFLYAVLSSFNTFFKYAKLWELSVSETLRTDRGQKD
ncbi:glycosyltransferase family 2 protein [Geobacter argillaceus]|uniref:Glycosyltransferase involved in cell wall biosynthesis n=1 Tax=Geobacter argillaceus TaxID=345631 RepID=A0A562VMT2_9BACT|nr:glycosyltransferase family 2 protein [Geobacter argillaceus]TWJ19286.1 glycosyltransferase involved in cell wall biosynthesis [Geobacter argillaceus]